MNMNFHRSHGFDLKQTTLRTMETSVDKPKTKSSWKYAAFSLIVAGVVFLAANAPIRALLLIGGAIVVLAGLATFVCIRAQNETPYW